MRRVTVFLLSISLAVSACDSTPTSLDSDDPVLDGQGLAADGLVSLSGATGVLVNGDMETDEGWWFYGPEGTTQGFSTEAASSGDRSASLTTPTTTSPGEFSFAGQYTPISDPTGVKYVLTVRMKLEGVTGQGAAIAIRGDTDGVPSGWAESFSTTQGKQLLVGTTDWTEVTVELDNLEPGINSIAVYLILLSESSGTVYFDDAELTTTGSTPIRTLQNGEFESGVLWPNYWWHGGRGYQNFLFGWQAVQPFNGAKAVSISRSNASTEDFGFWAQTINAQDFHGGLATLSVQIKTELVGEGVSIVIRGDDTLVPMGSGEVFATTEATVPITGTQDWTEYTVTLDNVPSDIRSLTVYLVYLPETTGTVSFDQASLVQ